jgi:amylosucrase
MSEALIRRLAADAEAALGRSEGRAFLDRLALRHPDIEPPLRALYGARHDPADLVERLVRLALQAARQRPAPLRELDRRREIDPRWFQRPSMVGYVAYVDRFAGTLKDLPSRLDYLGELGVTYLHLMPLLRARPGENDGGYAVQDYRSVEPHLGTMADLEEVARALHERDMSLCVDLVLNHTAQEHPWARRWLAGDPAYADFYTAYPDREVPDAYERTIMEVFPDRAPGSFTWFDEANGGAGGWVLTTFWSYQWDLDWANPNVFAAMADTVFWLANRGIDVFRMDAVAFMWKRLGTTCMNQPEVHLLMQALKAVTALAAPGVLFKAEAIVAPDELVGYLGGHDRYRPECELAYHNQLMVMLWSSLATRDARLMTRALQRLRPIPPETAWCTYVRGHDDIGWAVSDTDAAAVGWDGYTHRRFLNDFYSGRFPGSFADGALFQENPVTGDARISGSAASLAGIAADPDRAVRRIVLLYALAYAFGGIPLLYMGDELGRRNDAGYLADPRRADDNRWMHRPPMDWSAAERRHDAGTVEGRLFGWLARLARTRAGLQALAAGGASAVLDTDNPHVFALWRRHPRSGDFVCLANFAEDTQSVGAGAFGRYGWLGTVLSSDGPLRVEQGRAHLPGLGFVWLSED